MEPAVLESWIFGAFAAALLVAFHVFAHRVGNRRERRRVRLAAEPRRAQGARKPPGHELAVPGPARAADAFVSRAPRST